MTDPLQPSAAQSRSATMKLSFKCDLSEVRPAVAGVHDFLAKEGWNPDDLMSFDLALVEACNNAIQYVSPSEREFPVAVEASSSTNDVEFRVHDHTPGFELPARVELPPPDSEHGRGLFLMKEIMDYVAYFRSKNGNILIMRRARTAAA